MTIWRWVRHGDERLYDVGVRDDGSLHNPNGYPEETVRAAIKAAEERRHLWRSEAAKRAAVTRRRRQERRVYRVVAALRNDERLPGPARNCFICGKGLDDPQSIERGIGSDCWQAVLTSLEKQRREEAVL